MSSITDVGGGTVDEGSADAKRALGPLSVSKCVDEEAEVTRQRHGEPYAPASEKPRAAKWLFVITRVIRQYKPEAQARADRPNRPIFCSVPSLALRACIAESCKVI